MTMRYLVSIICLFFFISCSTNDPKGVFEDRTGLTISDPKTKLKLTDAYDLQSGEFSIVFKTSESQIELWLQNDPPWKNVSWHKGKIPIKIGISCQFNYSERVSGAIDDNGKSLYFGDKNLVKLLNDSTNYYSYVEDCCSNNKSLRFHDGRLLIVQPRTGMIYYSNWDF